MTESIWLSLMVIFSEPIAWMTAIVFGLCLLVTIVIIAVKTFLIRSM